MHTRPTLFSSAAPSPARGTSSKLVATVLMILAGTSVLVGCAQERPQSTQTPGLDTGITSSTGGGMMTPNRPIGSPTRVP